MTSKKIYLIRHGETDFNKKGIVQGSGIDSSLNENGIFQSKAFYNYYNEIKFGCIYTSTLKRSKESVQSFISSGINHKEFAGLNEINWGDKEGTIITPQEDEYYHWLLKQWQTGKTSLQISGGESPEDVARRQQQVIEDIINNPSDTILICMHGRAIRVLLCQLLKYPLHAMDIFEHQNLGLYILNFTGTMFSVLSFNSTDHLKSLFKKSEQGVVS